MLQIGRFNTLTLTRFTDHGAYVDGGDVGEILVPKAYVRPEDPATRSACLSISTKASAWWPLLKVRWHKWATLPAWKWHGSTSTERFSRGA